MDEIADRPQPNAESTKKPSDAQRRAWHAPKFMLTDIAQTDTQGALVTDAATVSQS